jgi:hypothetical protein
VADDERDPVLSAYLAARSASDADATAWAAHIESDPEDMVARASWLGWMMSRGLDDCWKSAEYRQSVVWLVTHHPGSQLAGMLGLLAPARSESGFYEDLRRLWIRAAEVEPSNLAVLNNAATFFWQSEPERQLEFLEAARKLMPDEPRQEHQLAQYWLTRARRYRSWDDASPYRFEDEFDQGLARKGLEHARRAVELSRKTGFNEWFEVTPASAAAAAGDWVQADSLATDVLRRIEGSERQGSDGTVAFHAHRIQGLAALRRGDLESAKRHLLSSCSRGPLWLSASGSDWSLARELLERGENTTVLQFLEACQATWSNRDDAAELWKHQIRRGEPCAFSRTGGDLVGMELKRHERRLASAPPGRQADQPRDPQMAAYSAGTKGTDEQAQSWLERLARDPSDLSARASWLGWCSLALTRDPGLRRQAFEHLEWLVRHHPTLEFSSQVCLIYTRNAGSILKEDLLRLWREYSARQDADARELGNAARFFRVDDPAFGLELLARAAAQQPESSYWPCILADAQIRRAHVQPQSVATNGEWYSRLYDSSICSLALEAAERARSIGSPDVPADFLLFTHMIAAAGAGQWERAAEIAREVLATIATMELPAERKERGMHHAHQVLGHAALRRGERETARAELRQSLACLSLDSPEYGHPSPGLAFELQAAGEHEAMVEYLERCRPRWKESQAQLDLWQAQARSGRTPEIGPLVMFHPI